MNEKELATRIREYENRLIRFFFPDQNNESGLNQGGF